MKRNYQHSRRLPEPETKSIQIASLRLSFPTGDHGWDYSHDRISNSAPGFRRNYSPLTEPDMRTAPSIERTLIVFILRTYLPVSDCSPSRTTHSRQCNLPQLPQEPGSGQDSSVPHHLRAVGQMNKIHARDRGANRKSWERRSSLPRWGDGALASGSTPSGAEGPFITTVPRRSCPVRRLAV